jgi:hypothetical protein
MLHGMRRRCDGSREQAYRWQHGNTEVVMGGQLDGGNFAGVATRARSRGRLGENGPDKQARLSVMATWSKRQRPHRTFSRLLHWTTCNFFLMVFNQSSASMGSME